MTGALLAGLLVGGLRVGSVAARFDLRTILAVTFVGAGLALGVLGALPSLPSIWPSASCWAAQRESRVLTALMLQKVPAQARGRIFGALNALSTLATPSGTLARVSLPVLFAGFGTLAVLAGASFLTPLRDDLEALQA
ncbi:MAG: hypothetical protein M0Z66_04030 [Thermaerobacter sp.]|nr:hypothetical protein [Thermaerobacter sp.]